METSVATNSSFRLRSDNGNSDVIERLKAEVYKLESQLSRLEVTDGPHRSSLIKTYQNMIESRLDLLDQIGA